MKPFKGTVGSNGQATAVISRNTQSLIWQMFQIGFALNLAAFNPQVRGYVSGIPLTAAVAMQLVRFTGFPYQMRSYFVGPPCVGLKAGDQIVCAVTNATPGNTFTAGAYIPEEQDAAAFPA